MIELMEGNDTYRSSNPVPQHQNPPSDRRNFNYQNNQRYRENRNFVTNIQYDRYYRRNKGNRNCRRNNSNRSYYNCTVMEIDKILRRRGEEARRGKGTRV
jgi:hypothetical protein